MEAAMILRILLGVGLGGAAGFAMSHLTRNIGSSWALTCNPYVSVPLGALLGLIWALG